MLDLSLKSRVALVTGAGRGIGEAIAHVLAEQGAYVVCVSRTAVNCERVAKVIQSKGEKAEFLAVDVTDRVAIQQNCSELLERLGKVDILINNAGITRDNVAVRMSEEEWDEVIQTNLTSAFLWTKFLLHSMTQNHWGRVMNISSVVGRRGNFGQANYAAAKAGLIGFTKSIAREVASRDVCVNAIAPGFIDTDMTRAIDSKITDEWIKKIPMKRKGSVQDVAALVAFLCSNAASYITGQVLTIDGGMTM